MTQPATGGSAERPDFGDDGKAIEGGFVGPLEEYPTRPFQEAQHRAETARWLAIAIVVILGASFFIHYGVIVVLEVTKNAAGTESLSQAFNAWLPIISGLAGGAVTFYFTKERGK